MSARRVVIEYRGRELSADDPAAFADAWIEGEDYLGASAPITVDPWTVPDCLTIFESAQTCAW